MVLPQGAFSHYIYRRCSPDERAMLPRHGSWCCQSKSRSMPAARNSAISNSRLSSKSRLPRTSPCRPVWLAAGTPGSTQGHSGAVHRSCGSSHSSRPLHSVPRLHTPAVCSAASSPLSTADKSLQGTAEGANSKRRNSNLSKSLWKGGNASSGSSKKGGPELKSSNKHPTRQPSTSSSGSVAVNTTTTPNRRSSGGRNSELQPLFQLALLSEVISDSEGLLSRALKAAPPVHIGPPSHSASSSMRRPWGALPRPLVVDMMMMQRAGNMQPVTEATITAAIAAASNCEDLGAISYSGLSGKGPGEAYQRQGLATAFAQGTVDGGLVMQAVISKLRGFMVAYRQLKPTYGWRSKLTAKTWSAR